MKKFLDPLYWGAVSRSPAAMACFAADLSPIFAIAFWGWGAVSLIMLCWFENVIVLGLAILRGAMVNIGRDGRAGLLRSLYEIPAGVIGYGAFCIAHGAFLLSAFRSHDNWPLNPGLPETLDWLFASALGFAPFMPLMVAILAAAHLFVFCADFIGKGEWKVAQSDADYGYPLKRLIIFQASVIVMGGALLLVGDPAFGACLLVLARAAWGLHMSMKPRRKPFETPAPASSQPRAASAP